MIVGVGNIESVVREREAPRLVKAGFESPPILPTRLPGSKQGPTLTGSRVDPLDLVVVGIGDIEQAVDELDSQRVLEPYRVALTINVAEVE